MRPSVIFLVVFLSAFLLSCTSVYEKGSLESKIKEDFKDALQKFNRFRNTDLNPDVEVVDKNWVIEHWGSYESKEELFYKAMLLLPANYTFKKAKEHDLGSFVAFTWKEKIFVVRENYDPESFKETIFHELEHLYQERFKITSDGSFDGEKAKASAIEGDAKLISRILSNQTYKKEELSELNEENAYFLLSYAPYLFGFNLAIETFNRTGDTLLLLQNPPSTMEQVIHPEKYFAHEGFERIKIGENQDRLGELFMIFFLASHVDDYIATIASEGWNGDAYLLNDTGWMWKVSFDTERDAVEFQYACNNMLTKIGEKVNGYFIVRGKYLPQKIKIERDGRYVTLVSHFLEV